MDRQDNMKLIGKGNEGKSEEHLTREYLEQKEE